MGPLTTTSPSRSGASYTTDGCKLLRDDTTIETYFHADDAARAAADLTKYSRTETPQTYARERAAKERTQRPQDGKRSNGHAQRVAMTLQRVATLNGEDLAEVVVADQTVDVRKLTLGNSICSACGTRLPKPRRSRRVSVSPTAGRDSTPPGPSGEIFPAHCAECGGILEDSEECRLSGMCLVCLNGPLPPELPTHENGPGPLHRSEATTTRS